MGDADRFCDFNINDHVLVKLTDHGREIVRVDHSNSFSVIKGGKVELLYPYTPPMEDADGWSSWQLWDLMRTFGHHLGNGWPVPFETGIRIDFKSGVDGKVRHHREDSRDG